MQRQRRIVFRERILATAALPQRIAAVDVGLDMARLEREHPVERSDRFSRTREREQKIAAIVERLEMIGRNLQSLVDAGERLVVALERVQDEGKIGQRIGRARVELERGGNQAVGLARLAALVIEHAEQVQRVEVVPIVLEHAAVDLLRLVQPALPVQADRVLDRRN